MSATQSLYELVEDAAAERGLAAWRVWAWALDAIRLDMLPPARLDASGASLPSPYSAEVASLDEPIVGAGSHKTWRQLIELDFNYVNHNKSVLPHFTHRYSMVTLDPAVFRKWLDNHSPGSPKRRPGAKRTKRQAIMDFVARLYPNSVPPGVKLQTICEDFEKSEGGCKVDERTLRRALGRK